MGSVDAEIHAYMQRAEHALKVAESNFKDDYWVDAVSKSYYAMFYAATALVWAKDLYSSKHSGIIALVGQHFAKPGLIDRHLHRLLIDMFDERQLADYEIFLTITEEQAQNALKAAEQFIAAITEYLHKAGFL